MFRVVVLAFNLDSRNWFGSPPSPPPCVRLKTSEPEAETIRAVDLGMVSGRLGTPSGVELGSIVTIRLVSALK